MLAGNTRSVLDNRPHHRVGDGDEEPVDIGGDVAGRGRTEFRVVVGDGRGIEGGDGADPAGARLADELPHQGCLARALPCRRASAALGAVGDRGQLVEHHQVGMVSGAIGIDMPSELAVELGEDALVGGVVVEQLLVLHGENAHLRAGGIKDVARRRERLLRRLTRREPATCVGLRQRGNCQPARQQRRG